jgi:CheY-like chemotaxis protein
MVEGKNPCILIVDDEREIRETIAMILEGYGYSVHEASDGGEALRCLRSGRPHPDLILLDLMMPGMNGFEFRSHVTADPALAKIPVVVVTGAGTLLDQRRGEITVAKVLRKPIKIETLLEMVRHFCSNDGCAGAS